MVTTQAAQDLVNERAKITGMDNRKNADLLFPLNVFPSTIAHNFTEHEIRSIINKEFEKNNAKGVDFEFAVTTTSMIGDDLQSKNFYSAYSDSVNNFSVVYPLDPPGNSFANALAPQELLVVVVSHVKKCCLETNGLDAYRGADLHLYYFHCVFHYYSGITSPEKTKRDKIGFHQQHDA